ncbi:hypothetical protein B0A52_00463 [Exophiala mesophila]|uniref:Zn(2)-C6 fungal-type domain-containing protein n=1 Tax=Exophiala mesophila TaxID=212818 RepID=A0A438NK51_EXOME|nr:hypothetical protein B0A52_00463 [Exophiala mesophila]
MTSSKPTPRPRQQRVLQACSACKRRKVRCTGQQPCSQCDRLSIQCVYVGPEVLAVGRSRLGVANRGAIITESRAQSSNDELSLSHSQAQAQAQAISSPSVSSTASRATAPVDVSRYGPVFMYSLVSDYMAKLYPICPVLDETDLRVQIDMMYTDNDAATLVYAFAALALLLMQVSETGRESGCYSQCAELLALSLQHYKPLDFDSKPNLTRIIGCLFLEMGLLSVDRKDLSFFYLHQAISLMLMHGLDYFLGEITIDPVERARRERVYWVCFIHERHQAIEGSNMICLEPLPSLPDVAFLASDSVGRGWNHIIQTFLVIDRDFVRFWKGDRSSLTAEWIQTKHQQFTDPSWELEVSTLAPTQQADLIITRQWLRTLLWQMAMSKVLLSSAAGPSEGLSLSMPLRLSSQLKACFDRVSSRSVAIDVIGLISKLFEITNTIADVLVALPLGDSVEEKRSRIQDFLFAKNFLFDLPHVKPIYRDILEDKVRQIRHSYSDSRWDDLFFEINLN